jgi:hypothetical protein
MASTKNVKCLKNNVLPFFFEFSCNLDNAFPLLILLKFQSMASSETNLNGSKVESNLKSRCNNLVVQLVCLGGLLTFIPQFFKMWHTLQCAQLVTKLQTLENSWNTHKSQRKCQINEQHKEKTHFHFKFWQPNCIHNSIQWWKMCTPLFHIIIPQASPLPTLIAQSSNGYSIITLEMVIKDTNKLWFIGERSIIHGGGWQLT